MTGTVNSPSHPAESKPKPASLGWRVGQFVLDCFRPDKGSGAGNSAAWDAYRRWCARRNEVPLAFAVFNVELEKVAEAVGIAKWQHGAHVHYLGVKLVEGAA